MSPSALPAPRPVAGVVLIVLMAACFGTMDTTVKVLGATLPVLVMLFARYLFQAVAMALWILRGRGRAGFVTAHPRFQVLRGLLLLTTSAVSFWSVQLMPVAEFTAITMLTPVIVVLLSALALRDPVSPLRWTLVAGGFAGALIVIRPGSALFGAVALLPLAGAIAYACFQLLTSRMSALDDPTTTHFYTGAVGSALLGVLLLASPTDLWPSLRQLSPGQFALLTLVGALGTAGHLMLLFALRFGRPATLMPFMYTQLAFAALAGYVAFGQLPDAAGFVGMAIIGACGAASVWLNLRAAAERARAEALAADSVSE